MEKLIILLVLVLSSCSKIEYRCNHEKFETYMDKCVEQCKSCSNILQEEGWRDDCEDTATKLYCKAKVSK